MIFSPIVFKVGAWSKHLPFAYDLVKEIKPKIIVELGTHQGESYFAFCQSVKDNHLPTVCYAVDTWQGDHQAGYYGNEIFDSVNSINNENFGHFSYLIRSFFDDASAQFANGTIDLLHIDGLHTYDAVKNDFDVWLPKMSQSGIILFHDIMVRHMDFGVWKLWAEIESRYTTFTFRSGHGLGVLFLNPKSFSNNSLLQSLINKTEESSNDINEYYQSQYDIFEWKTDLKKLKLTAINCSEALEKEKMTSLELKRRLVYTEEQLKNILNSRSWRLVKILKKVKDFFFRLS